METTTAERYIMRGGIRRFPLICYTEDMDVMEGLMSALRRQIAKTLEVETGLVFFDTPPSFAHGDIAVPCFSFSKVVKKAPQAIAMELAQELKSGAWVTRWSAAGPYLNITLNREAVSKAVLAEITTTKTNYGTNAQWKGERIMMEYVSPNTNKPLHLGHARNAFIGWTVSELLKQQGAKVMKAELINDRGVHIAKTIVAYNKWARGKVPKVRGDVFVADLYVRFSTEAKKNPELLVEAQETLRKWEAGDAVVRMTWKKLRAWVLAGFSQTYKRLGIDFDKQYFESEIYKEGKEIIAFGVKKGVFKKQTDNSVIVPLEAYGMPDKIVLRQDGTSLYITQDLALAAQKAKQFKLTRSMYCVGQEQDLAFRQLFKILELLGFSEQLEHLSYGLVFLPEGKMKSREGTVVDADELLDELESLAEKELKQRYPKLSKTERTKRTKAIALAAFKFHFLLVGKESPVHFDPKASISFEGNTGPYLLYTYARAASILRKVKIVRTTTFPKTVADETWAVISSVSRFPAVSQEATEKRNPAVLANALLALGQHFNAFYHKVPVLNAPKNERTFLLRVVQSTTTVLKNGLHILGIETIEKM